MSNVEQKLDKVLEKLEGQDKQLDSIALQVSKNQEDVKSLREDFSGHILHSNQKHQELLDKLASKDAVDDHESRITNVEEKVFS